MSDAGVFQDMGAQHWLGTDYLGRDMLVRIVAGTPYTIGVALVATLLACGAGALLGLLAAVTGGWVDAALSRVLDTLVSIPSKMFALVVIAGFGSSVPLLVAVAAIVYTPGCYRIIRSLAVNINAMDYVTVARARGEGRAYIMRREVLPNITGPLLADMGLRFVYALRLLASLSFLGLGVQPPMADWGSLVRENLGALPVGGVVSAGARAGHRDADHCREPGDRQPAGPHRRRPGDTLMGATVLVNDLRIVAQAAGGGETAIVKDISFRIEPGEVLALIGESGSGKTTIGLALMGYARRGCRIAGGSVRIGDTEVLGLTEAERRQLRGRRVSYIAQSAAASFNPSRTIMDQVVETAHIHCLMPRAEAERKAVALFRELALPHPDTIGQRYPHQVSGGQLQRLMAAMALMSDPDLVIFDEPTTALDVTTQIEVLHAFRRVVRERKTTAVYVTHDLAVVAQMADRILVLRDGAQREIGVTSQIIGQPNDDYTQEPDRGRQPESARRRGCGRGLGAAARNSQSRSGLWPDRLAGPAGLSGHSTMSACAFIGARPSA